MTLFENSNCTYCLQNKAFKIKQFKQAPKRTLSNIAVVTSSDIENANKDARSVKTLINAALQI